MRLKLWLMNINVMSMLLYASEYEKLNIQLEKRVLALENMCLGRIQNILWQEKVTNIEVCQQTGQSLVADLLKHRKAQIILKRRKRVEKRKILNFCSAYGADY